MQEEGTQKKGLAADFPSRFWTDPTGNQKRGALCVRVPATNRPVEIVQISMERCFAKDANLSPAPALRPPAGRAAAPGITRSPRHSE